MTNKLECHEKDERGYFRLPEDSDFKFYDNYCLECYIQFDCWANLLSHQQAIHPDTIRAGGVLAIRVKEKSH